MWLLNCWFHIFWYHWSTKFSCFAAVCLDTPLMQGGGRGWGNKKIYKEQSRGKPINVEMWEGETFPLSLKHLIKGTNCNFLTPHPGKLIKFLKLKKIHQNQVSGLDFRAGQSSKNMSQVKKLRLKSEMGGDQDSLYFISFDGITQLAKFAHD